MTIREALQKRVYKLRLDGMNPTQYLEIRPTMFGAQWGYFAEMYDNGNSMPVKLTDLDWTNEWLEAT